MAVHSPRRKLDLGDFERFPEGDHQRHEILDGVHVVTPTPFLPHQRVSAELYWNLRSFVQARSLGEVFFAPLGVVLSSNDILEPDLFYVSNERAGILSDKYVLGAPDLVVEILSQGTRRRDLGLKRIRYEALGVGEYWIVDPNQRTATVYRRSQSAAPEFQPPRLLSAKDGDLLTTPLLPGLEIPLPEIFLQRQP